MEQSPLENNPDLSLVNNHYPNLPSDWEDYRDVIQELYLTKDMALPDVVEEMKRDYKFVATERQYKRRISEWHLDKNVKDEEMRTIIAVDAMRLRQGKKSTFHVRGRLVDRKKIDRFVQRKRIDRGALEGLPGMQHFTTTSHYSASDYDRPPIIYGSEDPGRGTSNRGLIHGNTSGTRGVKRARDLGIIVGDVGISLDSGRDHQHQKGSSPIRKRTRHAQAKDVSNGSVLLGESKESDDTSVSGTRVTASGVSAQRPLTHSEDMMASTISGSDWNHRGSAMKHLKHRQNQTEQRGVAQQDALEPQYYQQRSVSPFLRRDQSEPPPPDIDIKIETAVDGTMLPEPQSQNRVAGRRVSEHGLSPSMIEHVKKFMDDFSWAGIAPHVTLPNMTTLTADTARPSNRGCPIPSKSNSGAPEIPTHLATYQSSSQSSISDDSSISTEIDSRERHRKSLVGLHTPPSTAALGTPATKNPLHKLDLDFPSPYSLATSQKYFSEIETSLANGTAPPQAVLDDTQTSLDIASQLRALRALPGDASQIRLNYLSTHLDHLRGSLTNVSEEEPRGASKLTINDLLQAAENERPPDSPDATTLDRTFTDIYQDELYSPF
ncbi:MAG: hypothetical protein LQ349_007715 [Xanthoria aureola]|nr:MAG: hypothetical protein LQ349_007715 [Xanthoria aureola]